MIISDLKRKALNRLSGNWTPAVLIILINTAITFAINFIGSKDEVMEFDNGFKLAITTTTPLGYILSVLALPLAYGVIIFFINLARDKEFGVSDLFKGYKEFGRVFVANLLIGLFILLWSLLFIIPGIIAAFSYSMTFYIMIDNPNMSVSEAIKVSKEMMKGHKGEHFVFCLSFIGWIILGLLTCGIGTLWVAPYMQTANVFFYEEVKAEYEMRKGSVQI